jgi:uncharacterized protein (TIGR03086 family)
MDRRSEVAAIMSAVAHQADQVSLLERALDQMAGVIAAIEPARQGGLATPCTDWDVRALVRHVVGQDLRNFLHSAQGRVADWQAPAVELGADWAEGFRAAAERLIDAWSHADLDESVAMPGGARAPLRGRADMQIAELAMHCWDLAKATSQRAALDPVLAEHALGWSRQVLRPEFRGPDKAFGVEVAVPPDAPAYDRLAGWFGRDPGWSPPV